MRKPMAIVGIVTTFLVLDFTMIGLVLRPLFQHYVGHLLTPTPHVWAALMFYLSYAFAVAWLVALPALRTGSLRKAAIDGAILGFAAYGTFEFTNMAMLSGWSPVLVASDVLWGTVLTSLSAVGGVAAGRKFDG